jgi:long-chain fatty acid transport protein
MKFLKVKKHYINICYWLSFFIFLIVSQKNIYSAGFAVRNQSASGLGSALSSDTTNSNDASGLFSNPAILTRLEKTQFTLGLNITYPDITYKNLKLSRPAREGLSSRTGSGEKSKEIFAETKDELNISKASFIPSLFGKYSINDEISLGLIFSVPWATNSDYEDDWIGRYYADVTKLVTYNLTPMIGYSKINSKVGLALGLQIQMAQGELSSAGDWCLKLIKDTKSCAKLNDPDFDATVYYKGDSVDFGYVFGVVVDPSKDFRLGFSFRSEIKHKSEGKSDITPIDEDLKNDDSANKKDITSSLAIPSPLVLSLGMRYLLDENLKLSFNTTMTKWSVLEKLVLDLDGTKSITYLKYQDSLYASLGVDYHLSNWDLRFGLGFEESAATEKLRSPRTPDNNRYIFSTGFGYQFGQFRLDTGYSFYLFKDSKINLLESDYPEAQGRGDFSAEVSAFAHVLLMSLSYKG